MKVELSEEITFKLQATMVNKRFYPRPNRCTMYNPAQIGQWLYFKRLMQSLLLVLKEHFRHG